jgi:ABC-type nickel/cobalt efflux system permease component RcnA
MFLIRMICLLVIGLGLLAPPAIAQVSSQPGTGATELDPGFDRRKLMVPPKNADGSLQVTPFLDDPVLWLRDQQQVFYRSMSGALHDMGKGGPAAGLTLMLLSFAYGVFHAAGPGHGKTVVSAWLLATANDVRRGIIIAFLSALIQALTAIAIVGALLLMAAAIGNVARDVAGVLESASYAMIAGLGAWLLWTGLRRTARLAPAPAHGSASPVASHHHFESFTPLAPSAHVHGPDCGCDHAHMPELQDLRGAWSWLRAFSLAFAVGIRPCTGALLVLVFANTLGFFWAGVAATFAMALGTFITVSAIAAVTVYARKLALRLASGDGRWLSWAARGLRLAAGGFILLLGGMLFWASLGAPAGMG